MLPSEFTFGWRWRPEDRVVKLVRAGDVDDIGEGDLDAVVVGQVVVRNEAERGCVPQIHPPIPPPAGQLPQIKHSAIMPYTRSGRFRI
jgi:hypothetical protein